MPVYRAETKFSTKKAGYSALSCVTASLKGHIMTWHPEMITIFCQIKAHIITDPFHEM